MVVILNNPSNLYSNVSIGVLVASKGRVCMKQGVRSGTCVSLSKFLLDTQYEQILSDRGFSMVINATIVV